MRTYRVATFLTVMACSANAAFDTSYRYIQNGGAENGMTDWHSRGVSSIWDPTAPEGNRSFRLSIRSSSHSDLRSPLYPIRRGEALQLEYSFKSGDSATIEEGSSYAVIRSYGTDTNVILSEVRYYFTIHNQWTRFCHTLTVDPGAYYIDVRFMFNDTDTGLETSGMMYVDDILVYREIASSPFYGDIQPLQSGDTLFVFDWLADINTAHRIAIQTLQGVLARVHRPLIWIDDGNNPFREDLSQNYGIQFIQRYDFQALLSFGVYLGEKRYVLYDLSDHDSITAATALAGIYNAVAIDVSIESVAIAKGYMRIFDARSRDCRWVYENYRDQLDDTAIVVHQNDFSIHNSAFHLRDWAPATKCLEWWYGDENYSRRVYRSMAPCSPVYGWTDGVTNDEGQAIIIHSEGGLVQIPSDWMLNLSVHASMGSALNNMNVVQTISRGEPQQENNVHYVTFVQSDMDNILTEVATNSFYSLDKFYANPHRGEFPMSWGMAPSLMELAPTAVKLWYDHATPNDSFTAFAGLGYFYPSRAPYLQTHAARLAGLMERADLRTLLILDNQINPAADLTQNYYDTMRWFTAIEQIRGFFYLEYDGYARHEGQILWFDNKPLVSARFDFRDQAFYGAVRRTATELAASINAMPTDPTTPDGYSVVIVHAWSRDMYDIYDTIQLLDSDVRVVHAEEFIEQLYLNMKPCEGLLNDGDLNGDCRFGFSDLKILINQWMNSERFSPANIILDDIVNYLDFNVLRKDWQEGMN